MGEHPDYTRWIFHGEAHRMRDEVVRQRIDECDAAGGIGDMLHDYEEAHFGEGPQEEEPEASTKSFYEMLEGGDEVQNSQDLQLLERLCLGRDSEDDIPPSDFAGYVDIADSDDEDFDPTNPDYDHYF